MYEIGTMHFIFNYSHLLEGFYPVLFSSEYFSSGCFWVGLCTEFVWYSFCKDQTGNDI